MSASRKPREARVAGVMADHLATLQPLSGRVLAVDDEAGRVEAELVRSGALVSAWRRRAVGDRPAHPWPPDGPFDAATLRLPKGRESLRMVLHAAASRIRQAGSLWLYGSNDEGVRSVGPLLESVLREVRTVETRGHCRIWRGIRGAGARPAAVGSLGLGEPLHPGSPGRRGSGALLSRSLCPRSPRRRQPSSDRVPAPQAPRRAGARLRMWRRRHRSGAAAALPRSGARSGRFRRPRRGGLAPQPAGRPRPPGRRLAGPSRERPLRSDRQQSALPSRQGGGLRADPQARRRRSRAASTAR